MIILFGLAAFVSTLLGGLFALRFKDRLHLVLGFSAGAVLGAAFFDLIPEAIELTSASFDVLTVMTIVSIGFIAYMILDRTIAIHHSDEHDHSEEGISRRGMLGAASVSTHSMLDGLIIGVAFKVSPAVGAVVAAAVLMHNFSDGINTVNLILKNQGSRKLAFRWLFLDAVAPVLGVIAATFITLNETELGMILALFAGFFLYLGASDLLPESHHKHPTAWTTILTIFGVAVLYAAIKLAGI